jgi:hypothetical protein
MKPKAALKSENRKVRAMASRSPAALAHFGSRSSAAAGALGGQ